MVNGTDMALESAAACRAIPATSSELTLTVSENDSSKISMSKSTKKESNSGEVVSEIKRETCRALKDEISTTGMSFMSTTVEPETDT